MDSIFANTIYTGKSIVSDQYLIFNGSKIIGLAKSAKGQLLGRYDVLTPAFIDPHSHIGMEPSGEPIRDGRAGWSKQQAIELVSRKNARILGIDDRLGTLQKGKWASFICWSGDPFDLAAAVYGEGELLFSE